VKWRDGLRSRLSIIVRRYTDRMKFYYFFHIFWFHVYHCIYDCMFGSFYLILYIMCTFLGILFHCVVLCVVCVQMCVILLPPDVNQFAVNKYMNSLTPEYQ
jgi:hypothetical protein